jgi:hypothetical protein
MLLFPDPPKPKAIQTAIGKIVDPIKRFLAFIEEREAIRLRRAEGKPRPLWTSDQIFQAKCFCNVCRERDRGTRWITTNWREPHADDPDLWFAMTVARLVNRSETLAALRYPVPWNRKHFLDVMAARGNEAYGRAYTIHADNKTGRRTPIYQVEALFDPLWVHHAEVRPRRGDTLAGFDDIFRQLQDQRIIEGLGPFYIGQIIADLKYVEPLKSATDWWTYCVPGPGSERGLNRMLGRPVKASWDETEWRRGLRALHVDIARDLERIGIGRLHAQDLQNCLCEFARYEKLRLGEGTARKFIPRM